MKKFAIPILHFAILAVFTAPAFSQSAVVQGKITEESTGAPLLGANIILFPETGIQNIGTSSDRNGDFELREVSPGTYRVSISFIGYETESFENFIIAPGDSVYLNVSLKLSVIESREIEVSAARQSINPLASSSSIIVIDTTQLTAIQPMSPADHIVGLAGVDVVKTGVIQSAVAVRGFNDVFSGSLLMMVDNRIGRLPSLRFNAFNFIPTSNEDIERIEIIRGPASALYGPNSANGVLHIITKSPFGSEGFIMNFGMGQRDIFITDFRYAGSYNNKIGYKITGSFLTGTDFQSRDSFEDSTRTRIIENSNRLAELGLAPPIAPSQIRIGRRNFAIEKLSGTAMIDYHLNDDLRLSINGGINWATNMELTSVGAAQIENWRYLYGQSQLFYKSLYMQTFINTSNSGNTFLMRDGKNLIDKSKLIVYQVQNTTSFFNRLKFTYGFDALWTRPITENTINGVNEDDDDINESGFYLLSESKLSDRISIIAAGRIDEHNRLKDHFLSSRGGLIFSPNVENSFKFTFNRAFSTPTSENLFLDRIVSPLTGRLQPFNVRASGVPKTGFTFRRNSPTGIGGFYMQPARFFRPPPKNISFIDADATLMWNEVVEAFNQLSISGLNGPIQQLRSISAPSPDIVLTI
ncbi:TonB-dependent receptor, partial [candidate division KSB1 bacterium]|nr:TonB-dependent receptor [candidate division KSB1 bacterium]